MSTVSGFLGAALTALATNVVVGLATGNLPHRSARASLIALLILAAVVGFLAGSAIFRRASRGGSHLGLFAALTGGVAGGILGCGFAFTITLGYLTSYSTWPADSLDQILLLLSYPVFSALGLCLGGLAGLTAGLLCGGLLRLTSVAR